MACGTLLRYQDFHETFKIHTDDSAFQLGEFISQKGKPIAFYNRKLADTQPQQTGTEREPLTTTETLNEFRTILLGHNLRMYTDNENLMCKNFNTDRVLICRLIIEDYGPDIEYTKVEKNIVYDSLSR